MFANRAYFRCLCSDNYMPAVTALPHGYATLLEHFHSLNIFQKCPISLFVHFFNCCNTTELSCQLNKALFFSLFSHSVIHISPFCIFTLSRVKKICRRVTKFPESFEPELCMFFFIICCLKEQSRYLFITCLLCYRGKVGVFVSCLRFACKCLPKILLCFCPCILICHFSSSVCSVKVIEFKMPCLYITTRQPQILLST